MGVSNSTDTDENQRILRASAMTQDETGNAYAVAYNTIGVRYMVRCNPKMVDNTPKSSICLDPYRISKQSFQGSSILKNLRHISTLKHSRTARIQHGHGIFNLCFRNFRRQLWFSSHLEELHIQGSSFKGFKL